MVGYAVMSNLLVVDTYESDADDFLRFIAGQHPALSYGKMTLYRGNIKGVVIGKTLAERPEGWRKVDIQSQ